jgi:hypothetical protein
MDFARRMGIPVAPLDQFITIESKSLTYHTMKPSHAPEESLGESLLADWPRMDRRGMSHAPLGRRLDFLPPSDAKEMAMQLGSHDRKQVDYASPDCRLGGFPSALICQGRAEGQPVLSRHFMPAGKDHVISPNCFADQASKLIIWPWLGQAWLGQARLAQHDYPRRG